MPCDVGVRLRLHPQWLQVRRIRGGWRWRPVHHHGRLQRGKSQEDKQRGGWWLRRHGHGRVWRHGVGDGRLMLVDQIRVIH